MKETTYPKLLIQTNMNVSLAHGTGAVLLKQLKNYPRKQIVNVFSCMYGKTELERSIWLSTENNIRAKVIYFTYPIKQVIKGERVVEVYPYKEAKKALLRLNFLPQVLYVNPIKQKDLEIALMLETQFEVPTILYFQDYCNHEPETFFPYLKSILENKRTKEFWVLTQEMADDIEEKIGIRAKVVNNQHIEIPVYKKEKFAQFDKDFCIVMMGTIYSAAILNAVKTLWRMLKENLPELSPIKWYAHPKAIDKIKTMNLDLGQEVQYAGFYQGEELSKKLLEAEMSIIPVNAEASGQDHIAKYSLPSRISELASLGIPMFVLASPDTATANYIRRTKIALCETLSDLEACKAKMQEFIQTPEMRKEFSQRARCYAEQNLDIKVYREELYDKFIELWKTSIRD